MARLWWSLGVPGLFLVLWAAGYVVAKIALQFAAPMAILGLRYTLVVGIMAVLFVIIRPPLPKRRVDWLHLGFVGFLMQTVYFGMAYFAFVNGVPAGVAALIFSIQPILVALIAPRWSGEAIAPWQWVGLILALMGTAVVIISRLGIAAPPVLGFSLAALALLGITLATLWEKRFGLSHHPITANLIGFSAGLLGLLPFLRLSEFAQITWAGDFIWAMAYLVIGNSVIAVGLLLAMIRRGEVGKISALLFLVPPVTAVMAWLTLDEIMPPVAWVGFAAAGVGVWMATRPRPRRNA